MNIINKNEPEEKFTPEKEAQIETGARLVIKALIQLFVISEGQLRMLETEIGTPAGALKIKVEISPVEKEAGV